MPIFANTFHSAALRGSGYLVTFWMIITLEKRTDLLGKLFTFIFFISQVCLWWCVVHLFKETRLIYVEGRHICLLVITFVILGFFLWNFVAEFLSKILLKWYLEWLCFWASMFWSCDGEKSLEKPDFKHHTKCAFVEILWSFLDKMISPSPVTGKIFSVQ